MFSKSTSYNIVFILVMFLLFQACKCYSQQQNEEALRIKRLEMVASQIEGRGIRDKNVLNAFRQVPRHLFVPDDKRSYAYGDYPIQIGCQQTISQPYMVALMTELLTLSKGKKVLEIGTGSGYQAAILAEMVGSGNVYTIEIIKTLAQRAKETLTQTGYHEVQCRLGDGYRGWPEHAPFDGIVVTAAPAKIPEPLLEQLAEGGCLVVPVDNKWGFQTLKVITRKDGKITVKNSIDCRFVPLLGEHGKKMPPE
ncbi:protein-L-isoaspartate(D-aspartate) O-methyltransferase [candidate division CSSED10-310 bacterium]|uniref:Protein-L-isoaspartate O-methyltransferase n=1 Tax=candidate division CSSED10-310 bacterium TaxID=2855610 RepID=A0ABV6YU27_UNCC1